MAKTKKTAPGRRWVWTDEYGIIGQPYEKGVEGGDSASWNGQYNYYTPIKNGVDYVKVFEVGFGGYVRHPHKHPIYNKFGWFYKNPWCGVISRDQKTGVLAGLIAAKDFKALLRFTFNWALKGFLFSNNTVHNGKEPTKYKFNLIKFFYNPKQESYYKMPDLTLFDVWQALLRAYSIFMGPFKILLFPILCLLDIHILFNTLVVNYSKKDDKNNYLLKLDISRNYVPTPVGWLAVKLLNKEHLKRLLKEYWTKWRDNPGMYDLQVQAIERLK